MPLEIIVVLRNTHEAIMGERKLLDSGLDVRVMPMPRQLGPGCGMALRIDPGDFEKTRELLGETIRGLYRRAGEDFVPWNP
ncbi:MAG: DUF3343 domain-containing protein [Treponema sp.]|jgi:hypothetical protein|nr:DUF3343 domain-containing protein [Treponema sp.]